jgi:hypothetical protein
MAFELDGFKEEARASLQIMHRQAIIFICIELNKLLD